MPKSFPSPPRSKPPWTPLQRRTWLATQRRRNHGSPPAPINAPVISGASYGWYEGPPPYADIEVNFSFDPGSYPDASVELWVSPDGGEFVLMTTLDSFNASFYYPHATENETVFYFKMRYVNGTIIGPFSNVLYLEVPEP